MNVKYRGCLFCLALTAVTGHFFHTSLLFPICPVGGLSVFLIAPSQLMSSSREPVPWSFMASCDVSKMSTKSGQSSDLQLLTFTFKVKSYREDRSNSETGNVPVFKHTFEIWWQWDVWNEQGNWKSCWGVTNTVSSALCSLLQAVSPFISSVKSKC